ncbi:MULTISPECIES: hypothetical protein [Kordiimonas]|jgi:translation initiation factor 1 (eIF-1/SUI1)|uniref:hypothetical protein n=1 Tax=Kordiimonas TaxID=288021 RepID=UPI00257B586F|nr:hypothetical protein [Kordiimonas sp. UBA4487]
MWMTPKQKRRAAAALGIAASSLVIAGASHAMIAMAGGDEQTEQAEKAEKNKRTIRVVRSGDSKVEVHKKGHRTVLATSDRKAFEKEQQEALEKARAALNEVTERLMKAKSKSEVQALKAAQKGLEAAIISLEERRMRHVIVAPSRIEIARIESEAMAEALTDLSESEAELSEMRIELKDEIAEARREIEEALGDLELELDIDGDIRTLRIESLKSAQLSLEEMEKHHLEALKQAEADIKRERERIEQRLREREAEANKKDG